jgi:hypothetical protein
VTTRTLIVVLTMIGLVLAMGAYLVNERDRHVRRLEQRQMEELERQRRERPHPTDDGGKPSCLCEPGDPLCACL